MTKQSLCNGIYFFHFSFLNEICQKFITKNEISECVPLLMKIITETGIDKKLITCDRTMEKMNTSARKATFIPAVAVMFDEKSLPDDDIEDDDEYALKVASFNRIKDVPMFFIVHKSEKEKIDRMAHSKGYNLIISSAEDFEI